MSFAGTMIWMICTAIAVLLLLSIGFTAMAGALTWPKSWPKLGHRHHGPARASGERTHRFHLRHGH